jgi:translation elongation factor EF-4
MKRYVRKFEEAKITLDTIKNGDLIFLKDVKDAVKVTAYTKNHPMVYTSKGIYPVDKIDLDRLNKK